jgi:hypothetical protein
MAGGCKERTTLGAIGDRRVCVWYGEGDDQPFPSLRPTGDRRVPSIEEERIRPGGCKERTVTCWSQRKEWWILSSIPSLHPPATWKGMVEWLILLLHPPATRKERMNHSECRPLLYEEGQEY